jgi:hypothetical protein
MAASSYGGVDVLVGPLPAVHQHPYVDIVFASFGV